MKDGDLMTIGIDIDDTITNTSEYANNVLKKYKKYSYAKDYHDLKQKDKFDFLKANVYEIHQNCLVKDNVVEVLKWLKDNNWRIVLITARGNGQFYEKNLAKRIIDSTIDYLEENSIIYDKIVFNQFLKSDACVEENVDIYIDDKEYILDDVAKKGIRTLKSGNISEKSKHQVVSSWLEIKDVIVEVMARG